MKTLLLVSGGRPVPEALRTFISQANWQIRHFEAGEDQAQYSSDLDAVMLLSPCWVNRSYEYAERLWYIHLRQDHASLPLLVAGYQRATFANYLDLLQLPTYSPDWWQNLQPVLALTETDYQDTLIPKLYRFFAGHGTDSVVAVMIRIRLVVQMAQRELLKMHTPYAEIYQDLIAPARLADKWMEWRNRWVNYYPLFVHTPLAGAFLSISDLAKRLDQWMLNGGAEESPLASGEILTILNALRDTLQEIENQYVFQKLSYSHR